MNISDVYKKYQIMPQLAEHQLKVAGVAKLVCDNSAQKQEADDIIAACLLHDMGNVIKFDLSVTDRLLPGRFSSEELAFWQRVKDEFMAKYGKDEHHATVKIIQEIGISERVVGLVDCIGFQNGKSNAESGDWGKETCAYSDMRVGPAGVISLEQRFQDLRVRYDHKHRLMGGNEGLRLEFEAGLRQIEKQLFEKCRIRPEEITEERVLAEADKMKNFELKL